MRRTLMIMGGLLVLGVAPAAAQWAGMPVWNSPKGGTGITVSVDAALPDDAWTGFLSGGAATSLGGGTAFGIRGSVGFGNLTLTAGLTTWEPDGAGQSSAGYGGQASFRIFGGALMPVSVNLQGGASYSEEILGTTAATSLPSTTRATGAVGVGVNIPLLGIELYASPGVRYTDTGDLTIGGTVAGEGQTNFGMAIGGSARVAIFSVHLAYDFENTSDQTLGTIGVGASVGFRVPGM